MVPLSGGTFMLFQEDFLKEVFVQTHRFHWHEVTIIRKKG